MTRCTPSNSRTPPFGRKVARLLPLGLGMAALLATTLHAQAQTGSATLPVPGGLGGERTFPDAARRGTLQIAPGPQVLLNGQVVRTAPGLRLFSPQNTLVMLHTVVGQSFRVNYVIEHATGMLLTAWILTEGEAARPRPTPTGSSPGAVMDADGVLRNYRTESDTPVR
ncbi:MAG: hypothetical protein ACK40S_09545 [Burkholderiaceae bacterium]